MNKCTVNVWGRVLDMEVIYDCYTGEEVLDSQREALETFMKDAERLMDSALPKVKEYCLQMNRAEIGEDTIANIFKFVKPKSLFVKRTDSTIRKVAIICAYRFNPEDGLAIVFQNEDLLMIGTENVIL